MKQEELEKLGLTKEQIDSVLDIHHKEIDSVNKELETTKNDLTASQEKVKTTEEALKAFDGVNPAALNQEIAKLKDDLQKKDAEHKAQIADRDFNDLLKEKNNYDIGMQYNVSVISNVMKLEGHLIYFDDELLYFGDEIFDIDGK